MAPTDRAPAGQAALLWEEPRDATNQAFGVRQIDRPGRRRGVAQPHSAKAAARTATVWWVQGFAEQEDISFKKLAADYEKASGNTLDYAIFPYAPSRQKIVSAITSGEVPDLFTNNPNEILALDSWDDKLLDVTDVIETQKENYTPSALATGLPDDNDGKPVPAQVNVACGLIPKGAKNVDVAKDFLKYLIEPRNCGEYLKGGLGRNIPAMPSIVEEDRWWSDDPHRAA
jgi:ABC-type glycerol-3-phosphate transport system substrate-binding protein